VRRFLPEVLRTEPQFRLLFAGGALSVIGDRVTLVALPFAVLAAGGDVSDVGLVAAAQFLPFLLLALPAGVIADRRERKWILVRSDAICGICHSPTTATSSRRTRSVLSRCRSVRSEARSSPRRSSRSPAPAARSSSTP
jgi:hypothetical protein